MPIAAPLKTTLFGAIMTIAAALHPHGAEAVNIKEITSPGGIKAWLVEDYTVPIVTMNIALRGGAAQEDDDKAGLANLLSGLLDEGAGELDSKTFQTRLQDLNVNLSFDTGRDAFYGNLPSICPSIPAGTRFTAICGRFRPIRMRPSNCFALPLTSRASMPNRWGASVDRCSPA